MTQNSVFDNKTKTILTDITLTAREKTLLGFERRFARVNDQLRLLLNLADLSNWSKQHHQQKLPICDLVAEQYPLVISTATWVQVRVQMQNVSPIALRGSPVLRSHYCSS